MSLWMPDLSIQDHRWVNMSQVQVRKGSWKWWNLNGLTDELNKGSDESNGSKISST